MFASSSTSTPAPPPSGNTSSSSTIPPQSTSCSENPTATKRKRRPAGTPDPDAEVVSLSPRTLLESDRYVCDICNQGFQREQNLQMHRRRHKVPWKLVKREGPGEAGEARKRVFVCPEPSCLHHDPGHALGDLVGIKKHFRRKHSDRRQWACARCSKAYAVHSDYKAHLKTCGTRGHSCDCGRVFSRVESFIEHQDACSACRAEPQTEQTAHGSRTSSSPSPSTDTNTSTAAVLARPGLPMPNPAAIFLHPGQVTLPTSHPRPRNLELQLLPTSSTLVAPTSDDAHATLLQLSIGASDDRVPADQEPPSAAEVDAMEQQLRIATEERREAKMSVELAEQELANAKEIRQRARAELDKAHVLRDEAANRVNSMLLHMTCDDCRQLLQAKPAELLDGDKAPASPARGTQRPPAHDSSQSSSHQH